MLDSTTRRPVPFVGHSKGGGVVMQLADALPHRCTHLVNLDGLPSRRNWPDVPDHERRRLMAGELQKLARPPRRVVREGAQARHDRRAGGAAAAHEPAPHDGVAALPRPDRRARRGRGRRRLWRWKLDPILRFGGFGPWRPEWSMLRMPGLAMPVLGVLGLQNEAMGWGTQPDDVEPYLPPGARVRPARRRRPLRAHRAAARRWPTLVLDFLGLRRAPVPAGDRSAAARRRPGSRPSRTSQAPPRPCGSSRTAAPGWRCTRCAPATGRRCCSCTVSASARPPSVPSYLDAGTDRSRRSTSPATALSTIPLGGGYTAEVLLADADAALRALGQATVLGRGLGAYVALLLAGARPDLVCGAILSDGPGILGGGNGPGSPLVSAVDADALRPPDPFALVELARDLRPPDYATSFARLATQSSPLEQPIAVAAVNRPEWLEAVCREPGVVALPLSDALALYGSLKALRGAHDRFSKRVGDAADE